MRKLMIVMLAAALTFSFTGCGGSGEGGPGGQGEQPQAKSGEGQHGEGNNPGQKPGDKSGASGEIDVDSLDIPDRLKEAIKSGQIPPDQVQAMLARMQGGGDAVPVSVEPVQRANLNSYLVLNGIVEPERKIEIFSRLS
ncbi:MAG: hypothetical protein ACERK6_11135, partial [Candidatus Aminicenantaceae bacterium]